MNPDNPLSLQEFLDAQAQVELLATIETIEDEPNCVKVTPYLENSPNCPCDLGMKIPRDAIGSVMDTKKTRNCCGKTLKVVVVHFVDNYSWPINDVFGHVAKISKLSSPKKGASSTCVCDHYVDRFCSGGQWWEHYLCYDETGAPCGKQDVPTGVPCDNAAVNAQHPQVRRSMRRTERDDDCPSGWEKCGNGCYQPGEECCCCDKYGKNCYTKSNPMHYSCYNICR